MTILKSFVEEMPEIEEHVKECSSCREELDVLKRLDTVIREKKDQLAEAFVRNP